MARCIVMYSGGLDSTVAVHLLKNQGLDVLALHFILPFYSGLGIETMVSAKPVTDEVVEQFRVKTV